MPARQRSTEALRPVTRPRLYEQLVEQLCSYIRTERLGLGDRLPPERELAKTLRVSRASVSQALVALEVQGVVDVRHGDGAIVLEPALGTQVIARLQARRNRLPEVIEAREALEVRLAALAADRRTDADLDRIDEALDYMRAEIDRGERGVAGDQRFHSAVTEAGHSGLLAELMDEISELIRESRIESLSQPDRPAQSLAGHQRIADAIRAGDSAAAAAAMAAHIRLVSDVALLRTEDDRTD